MTEAMKRIKKELEIQGITQRVFAKRLGVTEVTVHRWLTGERNPAIDYVEQMVANLGLHLLIYK